MASFELLLREHGEIAAQVSLLEDVVRARRPAATRAMAARDDLAAQLADHLAREDAEIYPRLMACRDGPTAALARRFHADYGRLVETWTAYLDKWDEAQAARDWRGFCADTRVILAVLGARIRSENQLLYPAALGACVIGLREREPATAPA